MVALKKRDKGEETLNIKVFSFHSNGNKVNSLFRRTNELKKKSYPKMHM